MKRIGRNFTPLLGMTIGNHLPTVEVTILSWMKILQILIIIEKGQKEWPRTFLKVLEEIFFPYFQTSNSFLSFLFFFNFADKSNIGYWKKSCLIVSLDQTDQWNYWKIGWRRDIIAHRKQRPTKSSWNAYGWEPSRLHQKNGKCSRKTLCSQISESFKKRGCRWRHFGEGTGACIVRLYDHVNYKKPSDDKNIKKRKIRENRENEVGNEHIHVEDSVYDEYGSMAYEVALPDGETQESQENKGS